MTAARRASRKFSSVSKWQASTQRSRWRNWWRSQPVAPGSHPSLPDRARVVGPYSVNYRCVHHMFTMIPCWNLPRAHALLQGRGVAGRMDYSAAT